MVNICCITIVSFLVASNFILLPIGIYRLIVPPCDRDKIVEIPCEKLDLVTSSDDFIYYLHGCQITTTSIATYECQNFKTRYDNLKQCGISSRLLLNRRKLRAGAGGGGIHPKSKKKKYTVNAYTLINTQYKNTLLNSKKCVLHPLEDKFKHFYQMKMPAYMGCCDNITNITYTETELTFPFTLIGKYNNESGFDTDSCFNVRIGDIQLWQINMKENTLIILILGFMGLFYLSIICIVCEKNWKNDILF